MSNEMNDWGRRLEAGETDDAELKLAARLRAARPPVQSMPSATEAAIRARVLNSANSSAKPRFKFNWPRLNLGWVTGTALSGILLVLVVAMFSVLSQPAPATTPTEAIVLTPDQPTLVPAIACDGTAGEVLATVTSATFEQNVPLPTGSLDLSLLVDTTFSPNIAERATLYVGFASPERVAAWNTSNASLAPDGVEGLTRLEIEAGQHNTVVRMRPINTEALYNVAQNGRVAVFLALVCNADTFSPTVLFSAVQKNYTFTLPLAGLPSGTLAGTYTVAEGDTCFSIAAQFGVALSDLLMANQDQLNADCSNLAVGQTLKIPLAFDGAGDQVRIVAAKPAGGWLAGEIEVTVAYTLTTVSSATLQIAFVNPNWDGEITLLGHHAPWDGGLETEVIALSGNQSNATITIGVPTTGDGLQQLAENGQVALYAALTHLDASRQWSRLAYDIERDTVYDVPVNLTCNATRGLDSAQFKSVSIAPNSQLPNAPTAFEVEVEYQLESAPIGSLTVGWADPTWVADTPTREEILSRVSNSTSMMVTAEQNTIRLRGLIFDPDFSSRVAREGKLALWVALACGPTGERTTWLYSHVWPDHTYFVPTPNTANAVSVAGASLTPGATLPSALTPINVTVNYTLTTAPTATLQIGLANAEWPGSEVDSQAGTIFAVGAAPVILTADKNSVTVPFYYEPNSAAQMFASSDQVNLFATLSYQTENGEWKRLAYSLSNEFYYQFVRAAAPPVDNAWATAKLNSTAGESMLSRAMALSADGGTLAVGSATGVETFAANTLQRLQVVNLGTSIQAVAFSTDGQVLAVGGINGKVWLVETATGKVVKELSESASAVLSLSFSAQPAGLLAAGISDGTVKVWNSETGTLVTELKEHSGSVNVVAFSPKAPVLLSAGEDKAVRVWAVNGTRFSRTFTLTGHAWPISALALSPQDGLTLATTSNPQNRIEGEDDIRLWNIQTGQLLRPLQLSGSGATALTFTPDGNKVIGAAYGITADLRTWEVASGKSLQSMAGQGGVVYQLAVSPDGGTLYANNQPSQVVQAWEVASERTVRATSPRATLMMRVEFDPQGQWFATNAVDGTIALWRVGEAQPSHTLTGLSGLAIAFAFSPDGQQLAALDAQGRYNIWETATGTLLQSDKRLFSSVVLYKSQGWQLAVSQSLVAWLPSANNLSQPALDQLASAVAVSFSADGRWLALGNEGGSTTILNPATGQARVALGDTGAFQIAFSGDGQYLFTAAWNQPVRQWNATTGELVRWFENTEGTGFALSADGRILATTDAGGAVRFWDVASGTPAGVLASNLSFIWGLAFSTNGGPFFVHGDGLVKTWVKP